MQTSIDTYHRTSQVENWIEEYYEEITTDLPTKAVKDSLKLIIHNNIFEFGDYFLAMKWMCNGNTGYLHPRDNTLRVPR